MHDGTRDSNVILKIKKEKKKKTENPIVNMVRPD